MNRAIGRVYAVLAGGLVLLLGFTAYWQLWAETSLSARRDNSHQVVQELSIKRGLILAADGTKLAVNRAGKTADGRRVYTRRYPTRGMFAHIVATRRRPTAGPASSVPPTTTSSARTPTSAARSRTSCTPWPAARWSATTCSSP